MVDRRDFLKAGALAVAAPFPTSAESRGVSLEGKGIWPRDGSAESGNVRLASRQGVHWARLDNQGKSGVGAAINALIEAHADENGLDLLFSPGTYLIETPIVVTRHNISLQGHNPATTRFLVAPACRDAIQLGPKRYLRAFTLRNLRVQGQNGRTGVRPDILPEQNGIRIMPDTPLFSCEVDHSTLIHLTHGILNEHPESTMDVFLVNDNWIGECNVAIELHASLFASMICRNGLHDMSGTVLKLRGTNDVDFCTKETVISNNSGWNPGALVFDVRGFRGGTISDNAFMFNHRQVQCFARLEACHMTHVSGNTFVVDGTGRLGWNEKTGGGSALGYERDGERVDTLTIISCSDCTVSGNSLTSFNRNRPVIRVDGDRFARQQSRHNHIALNKILPSSGFEGRTQVELTELAEDNLVLLPMAAGPRSRGIVADHGSGNEVCALPTVYRALDQAK